MKTRKFYGEIVKTNKAKIFLLTYYEKRYTIPMMVRGVRRCFGAQASSAESETRGFRRKRKVVVYIDYD